MKALYISFNGFSAHDGISKKKRAQIKAFREYGVDIHNCYYVVRSDQHRVWMLDDNVLVDYGKGIIARIKQRICFEPIIQIAMTQNIDFIYIRHDFNANPFLVRTARILSQNNVKLLLELPTYPYDKEFKYAGWVQKLSLVIDKMYRLKYANHMFRIITFTNLTSIWKKKTIRISNGVDFEMIKVNNNRKQNASICSINLTSVAEVHDWHALDRLIEGMGLYYKNNPTIDVFLHIVGGIGPVEDKLFKKLIIQYKIDKYVLFYGPLYSKELDSVFGMSDIGVGSLGRHRSQITNIKTLKNREYAARGIPFFYSEIDKDFEDKPYIMKVPADESPIDVRKIIDFYEHLNMTSESIRDSIKNLSWKNQIEIIMNDMLNPNLASNENISSE